MFIENTTSRPAAALPRYHKPVLAAEACGLLQPREGALLVDCTLGGGGHTRRLLEAGASVIAFDRDPDAIEHTRPLAKEWAGRLTVVHADFRDAAARLRAIGVTEVDGVLFDLGVSSRQLDAAERGFSFQKDGPLDMRMSQSGLSAADIVNTWEECALARLFRDYGDEPAARRIARRIAKRRAEKPITTTGELAEIVAAAVGGRSGPRHPATRAFQALRMAVNDEIGALRAGLRSLSGLLRPGARMAVITFHSVEDREVKEFFRAHSAEFVDDVTWPAPKPNPEWWFTLLTRKAVTPSPVELALNPRARSAKLRAVERRGP